MNRQKPLTLNRSLPWILILCGAVGLLASFMLTYDKIHVLKDPGYQPACNVNPILSCGSVMSTEQASLLGIPNTIFGIVAFSVLMTIGFILLSGTTLHRRIWQAMEAGAVAGVLFMHYLFFQGVFRIQAICPWCFATWMITIPVFWYITLFVIRTKAVPFPKKTGKFLQSNHGNILFVWYLAILGILLQHFWYYWSTLL